jgi:hypothetical protein
MQLTEEQGEGQVFGKFWMVWCEDGQLPTFKHGSEESARREAERLARVHSGKRFYVLVAEAACEIPDPPLIWRMGDDIPF